ncbi:MAG TPA: hypothetical protein PLH94_12345 [Fimbriimonadaceae bacterium]|nr:hypothetical protein [Fimbriimonadaceae bacterium]
MKFPTRKIRLTALSSFALASAMALASTDAIPYWIGAEPSYTLVNGNVGSILFSDNFRVNVQVTGTQANPGTSTLRVAAANVFLSSRNFTTLWVAVEGHASPAPLMEIWLKNRTGAFERKGTQRMLTREGNLAIQVTNPNRYIQDGGFVHARFTFRGSSTLARIDQIRFMFE